MKIIRRESFYARNIITAQLTEDDVGLADWELVERADELTTGNTAPFGGTVEETEIPSTFRIHVYTD
jgi:hypothetical protein